jgi:hypothetical protein
MNPKLIALAILAGIFIAGCSGSPKPTPASSSPTNAAATVPLTTHGNTPGLTPSTSASDVIVDASKRPTSSAINVRLDPPASSPFQPWDGTSTVIYDTKTGRETNLGPGSQPAYFSPDSTKAVWVKGDDFASGTEAFLIDLATGATRSLGPARFAMFIDGSHVFIYKVGGNETESIDLASGTRIPGVPNPQGHAPLRTFDGYEILGSEPSRAKGATTFQVMDPQTHQVVLTVDALAAVPAGPGEIAVASSLSGGQSNIYLIDAKTGMATFVATALAETGNWPFAANETYVMWADSYCGNPQGQVNLFDRRTRQLVRLGFGPVTDDRRWVTFTPSGLVAAGPFGAKYLIDPSTMKYVSIIPSAGFGGGDVSWSPDYRYASHGRRGGHGGLCAG